MSCYLMEEEEIGAIAVANFRGITYDSNGRFYNPVTKKVEYINAGDVAEMLALQNIASCQARYPQHGKFAGGFLDSAEHVELYIERARECGNKLQPFLKPMKLYGLIKEYMYQACETDDWYETDAYWYCNTVAHLAAGKEQRAQEDKEMG